MRKWILYALILVIITGCNYQKEVILNDDYFIETVEKKMCDNNLEKYYSDNNQTIYLYCLESVILSDTNNSILLRDYIEKNNFSIDDIKSELTSKLKLEDSFWDGGTQVYRTEADAKHGITIITCNTVGNNNDVYIGPSSMDFKDTYCK